MSYEIDEIRVIELSMMDKRKYFPLTMLSGFCIRGLLYPVTLIKTRLQIQKSQTIYKGTMDAFYKISKHEGVIGLYRGFWVSCLQLFPSVAYIGTYETIRHHLKEHTTVKDSKSRSFIAGGCASVIGQTMSVPLDIITQHIMLLGQESSARSKTEVPLIKAIDNKTSNKRFGTVSAVIREVYNKNGLKGFYKGYFVSLTVFAPNSALWWFFYDTYSNLFMDVVPSNLPRLLIQCVAAPLAGISAAVITNPLDLIRARIQVYQTNLPQTVQLLWKEERYRILVKGLSARLLQSVLFSFFIILGYETIKRFSVLDKHKNQIRW
ncbi:solute carrier family 25 member 44 [Patella vulgata]|uniref:solute carrier family 25 member 44 n=1 Tax=Patella vulgata TaxID=6465 RepID=UPI00217F3E24|nr:solute carrier family 25 member 44 [Patella vulgata]